MAAGGAVSGGPRRKCPDSRGAGEAAADEVAQVEPGGAAGEPGVVLLDAARNDDAK